MPLVPLFAVLVGIVVFILSIPFLLVVRYRLGVARRPARRWIATVNMVSLLGSAALFLWVAALTNFWVPNAFRYSVIGFLAGVLLGLLGLKLTRWEPTARALYYTPSRSLVFLITLAVSMRLLYGLWRIWHVWRTSGADHSWLASAGIAGSMGVGALVIGYYLTYFAGVRWRLASTQRTHHQG
jgi:hypothetical protein